MRRRCKGRPIHWATTQHRLRTTVDEEQLNNVRRLLGTKEEDEEVKRLKRLIFPSLL